VSANAQTALLELYGIDNNRLQRHWFNLTTDRHELQIILRAARAWRPLRAALKKGEHDTQGFYARGLEGLNRLFVDAL